MSNLTLIFQINPRISNFLRLFLDVAPSSRAYGGGGGDEKRRLLVLHELGVRLAPEALSSSSPSSSAVSEMGTVLVVGDHDVEILVDQRIS